MTLEILIAVIAAFIAGNLNAIAGGGSFLTYPALLLLGNTGIVANATSDVALWLGDVVAAHGFKKEILRNSAIKKLIIPVLIGSVLGSFLLTRTPTKVFESIVPFLILSASLILLFQKQIVLFLSKRKSKYISTQSIFGSFVFMLIAIYGGYFGAGQGILTIAALSMLGTKDIYDAIGVKNFLTLIINLVAAIYFIAAGIVNWHIVPFMAIGGVAGGFTGPKVARYLDKNTIRIGVIIYGFSIAALLFLSHIRK